MSPQNGIPAEIGCAVPRPRGAANTPQGTVAASVRIAARDEGLDHRTRLCAVPAVLTDGFPHRVIMSIRIDQ